MRGADDIGGVDGGALRIIPARAGSSSSARRELRIPRDHPRACGEQVNIKTGKVVLQGSSPRVRGAAKASVNGVPQTRIIPARAGSSRTRPIALDRSSDHPRACGEQMENQAGARNPAGSSPRVRGAVCQAVALVLAHRIIPARAGSR